MTPVEQLIDLVNNHPDATATSDKFLSVLTLRGNHVIELSPDGDGSDVAVRKVTDEPHPGFIVRSYDLRRAVVKRMVGIFKGDRERKDPIAKILEGFK